MLTTTQNAISFHGQLRINSLAAGEEAKWHHGTRLTLVHVISCCMMAPNHLHMVTYERGPMTFTRREFCLKYCTKLCLKITHSSKIWATSPRDQWLKRSLINTLWPSDAIWRQGSRSTLVHVMACCLTAPSHHLNQCWLIITKVQWCSSGGNFAWDVTAISH